jgi:predicted NAD-dependent protein-ADP-ribosyltransferase YbiA (DUF1768 family)
MDLFISTLRFVSNEIQSPDLLNLLLGTKGNILVEASPYDEYWGAELAIDDTKLCFEDIKYKII